MDLQEIFNQTIASRALRKDFTKLLGTNELIYGEFEVLFLLLDAASLQPSSITSSLQCQPAATSRLIKSLHQRSFVEYDHDEEDRRQVYVSLTEQGKKLIDKIKAQAASAE